MNHAIAIVVPLSLCAALSTLVPAQAKPMARWAVHAGPYPVTLLVALGPSDVRCMKAFPAPPRTYQPMPEGVRQSATAWAQPPGWTEPLGLRVTLRW